MTVTLDREQMHLYRNVMLDVLSGPFANAMRSSVGEAGLPLYRALYERINRRLRRRGSTQFRLDAMDLAAIRSALALDLQHQNETDFYLVTGRTLQDARDLLALAEDAIREFRTPSRAISGQLGSCTVVLPIGSLGDDRRLVAVPDRASWDAVMPDCARGRRAEFLSAMKRHFNRRSAAEWRWEDFEATSLDDLRKWIEVRAKAHH